jgi:membrane-bound lytic murein transglycosylase D
MGTTDIAVIARKYKSASFGFASRNFYVSFLAALTIDRNPEQYFSDLNLRPEMVYVEVEMPAYVPVEALQRSLDVDRALLAQFNPALLPAVWEGRQHVPKGYRLRLPPSAGQLTTQQVALRVDEKDQFLGQPRPRTYRVRSGDTLSGVAARHGLKASTLASLNGLSSQAMLKIGQDLRLPQDAPATPVAAIAAAIEAGEPGAVAAATAPPPPPAPAPAPAPAPEQIAETLEAQREESRLIARARQRAENTEPVTAVEALEAGPSLGPGGAVARAAESINLHIAEDGSIRVAAEETIGHYADWLSVPASRVRSLNGLSVQSAVPLGRSLKLDFSKISREAFETKRRSYHEGLQAAFFTGHRITGTRVYVTRGGDSLWNIAQRNGALPTWLVLQYNPDIDFAALRTGQEIVIPKVEAATPA